MTSIYTGEGKNLACTVVEAGPCVVTQVRSEETDGYEALQLAYGEAKAKNTSKPMMGHFSSAKSSPKRKLVEFRGCDLEKSLGDTITAEEVFTEGDKVNVVGVSKGKGFQGVVKRHGFGGVGQATHGQHNRLRAPGAIGACSYPAKVFKGMKMAGQTGNKRVKVMNLEIVKIFPERNLILVKGAIPGSKGSFVVIEK